MDQKMAVWSQRPRECVCDRLQQQRPRGCVCDRLKQQQAQVRAAVVSSAATLEEVVECVGERPGPGRNRVVTVTSCEVMTCSVVQSEASTLATTMMWEAWFCDTVGKHAVAKP